MSDKTTVIFRVWDKRDGGGVIALFPHLPGTVFDSRSCMSYEHVGQHGPADLAGVISRTRPATPEEYEPLRRELERAPYNYELDIRERTPADAFEVRNKESRP
jgi:hypothetical protein